MAEPRVGDTGRSQRLSDGWQRVILDDLAAEFPPDTRSGERFVKGTGWMFAYFAGRGIYEWPDVGPPISMEFVESAAEGPDGTPRDPAPATITWRHWMMRRIYAAAAAHGAQIDPHTAAGPRVRRSPREDRRAVPIRPLTEPQLRQILAHADSAPFPTKKAIAASLAVAGASAAEIWAVRAKDVNLDARTVRLTGPHERVCPLDDWGVDVLTRHLHANPTIDPDESLCGKDIAARRASEGIATLLWNLIQESGFGDTPGIAGRSLRLTAGRRMLDSRGLEAAARLLGYQSLDNTALALGYQWRSDDPDEVLGRDRPDPDDPDDPDDGDDHDPDIDPDDGDDPGSSRSGDR